MIRFCKYPRTISNSAQWLLHVLELDYYVMAHIYANGGKGVKGSQHGGVCIPVRLYFNAATSSKLDWISLISAVREHGLVLSSNTQKLSSAHVPADCNLAVPALSSRMYLGVLYENCFLHMCEQIVMERYLLFTVECIYLFHMIHKINS
jgi:hypothetical protein